MANNNHELNTYLTDFCRDPERGISSLPLLPLYFIGSTFLDAGFSCCFVSICDGLWVSMPHNCQASIQGGTNLLFVLGVVGCIILEIRLRSIGLGWNILGRHLVDVRLGSMNRCLAAVV